VIAKAGFVPVVEVVTRRASERRSSLVTPSSALPDRGSACRRPLPARRSLRREAGVSRRGAPAGDGEDLVALDFRLRSSLTASRRTERFGVESEPRLLLLAGGG
jgi:hypothetical protein